MFKKIRERAIVNEVKEAMKSDSFLKGLRLNAIKSNACQLMFNNKISEEFYMTIFTNKKIDIYNPYWEVNKEAIEKY